MDTEELVWPEPLLLVKLASTGSISNACRLSNQLRIDLNRHSMDARLEAIEIVEREILQTMAEQNRTRNRNLVLGAIHSHR